MGDHERPGRGATTLPPLLCAATAAALRGFNAYSACPALVTGTLH